MITVKDAFKNTKPGIPYKFFDIASATDITEKVVFNRSKYNNMTVVKMIMLEKAIYYYL